ncbi:MalY/PatB family protein [Kribbella swartbergensis]
MLNVAELPELQKRRSEKWSGHAPGVIASTVAEMDFDLAGPIARVLHDAIDRSDLGYAFEVPRPLQEAFTGFAERRLGWTVDPARITVVPDVMAGLIELSRVLAPGGSVGFATAAYPPFLRQIPQAGLRTVLMPLRPDGWFDLDRLGDALRDGLDVLVLANPHNPTGRVLPREELEQIAELCASYGAWVLADEIHAPLVLPGATHVPWLEVSDAARECGIVLTSASKAFNLAGLKTALVVTAADRTQSVVRRLPYTAEQAGLLGVLATEVAFSQCDDWLDAVLRQLDENRAYLDANLPDRIVWTPPEATYLAWLDCRGLGLNAEPSTYFLEHAKVALARGTDYDPAANGFVRLNFGTGPKLLEELVSRLRSVLD